VLNLERKSLMAASAVLATWTMINTMALQEALSAEHSSLFNLFSAQLYL
jgi:hypothetical protein